MKDNRSKYGRGKCKSIYFTENKNLGSSIASDGCKAEERKTQSLRPTNRHSLRNFKISRARGH